MLARRVGRWKNDELFVEEGGEAWGGAGLPGRDEGLWTGAEGESRAIRHRPPAVGRTGL